MNEASIYCTASEEPFAPADMMRLHVSLAFETDEAEATAPVRFKAFLDALQEASFHLYEPVKDPSGDLYTLRPHLLGGKDSMLPPSFPQPAPTLPDGKSVPAAVVEWLGHRVGRKEASWTGRQPETPGTISHRQLTAGALLGSIKGWDAPLAGATGLSRLFELERGALPSGEWVVLPLFNGGTPSDIGNVARRETPPASAEEGAGPPDIWFECPVHEPGGGFPAVKAIARREPERPLPALLQSDGFFEASGPDVALLRRLRANAAAALSVVPHLNNLRWPVSADAPVAADQVQRSWHDLPDRLRHARLHWHAANGMIALLDPVVSALTMCDANREGPFVKIVNDALDQWRSLPVEENAGRMIHDATKWITACVVQLLVSPPGGEPARLLNIGRTFAVLDADANADGQRLIARLLREALDRERITDLPAEADRQVDAELSGLAQKIESEQGCEEIVLRVLDLASITDDGAWQALADPQGADLPVRPASFAPIADLRARLASNYNGADAARQATGSVIEQALIRHLARVAPDQQDLPQVLRSGDWYVARLGLTEPANPTPPVPANPLQAWLDALPPPYAGELDATARQYLRTGLAESYGRAVIDLLPPADHVRTPPATVPPPIVIQFAVDHDQTAGDHFDDLFQGVGLLLKRDEPDPQHWAYGNLADLKKGKSRAAAVTIAPRALHPLRPASEDGQRRLAVDYHGFPLASTKLNASADPEELDLAFYFFDDPGGPDLRKNGFTPVPALYYGARYRFAAFAVAASGALPPLIAGTSPWMLRPDLGEGKLTGERTEVHSRRTAIGQVALFQKQAAARSQLDMAIPGVQPLFRDYPRLAMAAPHDGVAQRDLWRARSGAGLLPPGETIILDDVALWGGAAATCQIFESDRSAKPQPVGTPQQLGAGRTMLAMPADADPESTKRYWVRVVVTGKSGDGGLSLMDPALSEAREKPGFALLAPAGGAGAVFRNGLSEAVRATVEFPRMSFLDFDRWISNPDLEKAARSPGGSPLTPMHEALMHAFATGTLKPGDGSAIEQLNRLPDLAVDGLLVTLTPVDSLSGSAGKAMPMARTLFIPKLGVAAAASARDILRNVEAQFQATLSVEPGVALSLAVKAGAITVEVPSGLVARLAVQPLVAKTHFEGPVPVMHPSVREWAVGEHGDHLVFDGPSLIVEVMAAPKLPERWRRDTRGTPADGSGGKASLMVQPAGRERRYRIVAGGQIDDREWRQLGSVDVATQRWRFLGRPLRRWIEPKKLAQEGSRGVPAVPLNPKGSAWLGFEQDAFGERDASDYQSRNIVLRPQPDETVLADVAWERPSASYFRHRLTLRSRYWGAMRNPEGDGGSLELFDQDDKHSWWARVAMLADRVRVDLTRPQLRALLPLTTSPDPDAVTPPVMAFLAEPPFAAGGLADRIAAEVKTAFSHEISAADGKERLHVRDSRKEAGPDPRLTYSPLPEDAALALTLDADGPVGLSFDKEFESAVFPNTAFVLTPKSEGAKQSISLAEHFFSISLRRYLDPAWTVDEDVTPHGPLLDLAYNEAWWIEFDPPGDASEAHTLTCGQLGLATIRADGVYTDRSAILPPVQAPAAPAVSVPFPPDELQVAGLALGSSGRLALLHQPLDGGRGSLSIFRLRAGSWPTMLASYEWSAGSGAGAKAPAVLSFVAGPDTVASPVSASTATSMYWTRTGVDADTLHLVSEMRSLGDPPAPDRVGTTSRVKVVRHGATTEVQKDGQPCWALPRLAFAREPLHVHRQLAVIATMHAGADLRDEDYAYARLAPARALPVDGGVTALRFVELELVAQPLCGGLEAAPDRYKTAPFDLVAIGRQAEPCDLLFFIRPLGGWRGAHAGPSRRLELRLVLGTDERLVAIDVGTGSLASVLLLVPAGAPPLALRIDGQGMQALAAVSPIDPIVATGGIVSLTDLRLAPQGGEIWADISLMTLPATGLDRILAFKAGIIALPLDRFFSAEPRAHAADKIVEPSTLKTLAEAEARVIAISSPVAIED